MQKINLKIVGKIDMTQFEKKPKVVKEKPAPVPKPKPDTIEVHFTLTKKDKLIGRTTTGKVAFIIKGNKRIVKNNQTWNCILIKDKETVCDVLPYSISKTAQQNEKESLEGFKQLKEAGFKFKSSMQRKKKLNHKK